MSKKYTVKTQLHIINNKDIISEFDRCSTLYNQAKIEAFYAIKNDRSFNKAKYNRYLQDKYFITKRMANSIIIDAQTVYSSQLELLGYKKDQLEGKINHLENRVIPKLVSIRDDNSEKLRSGQNVDLNEQRNLRKRIVAKKNKLNKLKQQLININNQIDNKVVKVCFGTKKLLQTNKVEFKKKKNSTLSYVGCKDETSCNQLFQIEYDNRLNQFNIKLRREFGYKKQNPNNYVYGRCYFNHHKNKIIFILKNKTSPLSYRIKKENNRYYLYLTFELNNKREDFITRSRYGTIGVDFNKGFVSVSETNKYGHLVDVGNISYRFKSGNKTRSDLEYIVNRLCDKACNTGKDLCIENLNFRKSKSRTESKQGKKYNDMLHSLAYSKFMHLCEQICYRRNIYLIKVNPAWTSYIAKNKFCEPMKLNIHAGASYVIARRGQGFRD